MTTRQMKVDSHIEALLNKALLITVEQARLADTVLLEMGVGGQAPDRAAIKAQVMQVLAANFNAAVVKSVSH